MAWHTLNSEIAALIGLRTIIERTGVGIVAIVIDEGRREVVA